MNIDLIFFGVLQGMLCQFGGIDQGVCVVEMLELVGVEGLCSCIDVFVVWLLIMLCSFKVEDCCQLMCELCQFGCLDIWCVVEIVVVYLGVLCVIVYNDEKE